MKKLSQFEFDALLLAQQAKDYADLGRAIEDVDLSDIVFRDQSLDAMSLALSRISGATFERDQSLYGVQWIGNVIACCRFLGSPMNKCEILDCNIESTQFVDVSLLRSDLAGTHFNSCEFRNIDFSTACLIRVSFRDCIFRDTRFRHRVILDELTSVDFDGAGECVSVA